MSQTKILKDPLLSSVALQAQIPRKIKANKLNGAIKYPNSGSMLRSHSM